MFLVPFCLFALVARAWVVLPREDMTSQPYTTCGADRGYTEADSLEASRQLETVIIRSDNQTLPGHECAYSHVNTTVVSVCNNGATNQTMSRAAIRTAINQLIQTCGLEGGFTGVHHVQNLTYSAYGITGAKKRFYKSVRPKPARDSNPTARVVAATLRKRAECKSTGYDGAPHTDCDWTNKIVDGKCTGAYDPSNDCQVFCELRRTGFYGPETALNGAARDPAPPGKPPSLQVGTEYSVTHGFSIGVEGVAKSAVGLGIGYEYSTTKTEGRSLTHDVGDEEADSGEFYSRWIFFPKMVEHCGTVGRKKYQAPVSCMNDMCRRQMDTGCVGEIEHIENVCTMVPALRGDGSGEPSVMFALRFQDARGAPAPWDKQPKNYRSICRNPDKKDADGDSEEECLTQMPA